MSYAEFLLQWYNLPFAAAIIGGGLLGLLRNRVAGGRWTAPLFIFGVTGLTLNGAIHDLSLGLPADRFPIVFALSVACAVGLVVLGRRLRHRFFPPVTGVTWNMPDLEGSEAQIVTPTGGKNSPTGRARVRDDDGVSHVVRIRYDGSVLRFGKRVRLGAFDQSTESYPVDPV